MKNWCWVIEAEIPKKIISYFLKHAFFPFFFGYAYCHFFLMKRCRWSFMVRSFKPVHLLHQSVRKNHHDCVKQFGFDLELFLGCNGWLEMFGLAFQNLFLIIIPIAIIEGTTFALFSHECYSLICTDDGLHTTQVGWWSDVSKCALLGVSNLKFFGGQCSRCGAFDSLYEVCTLLSGLMMI